MELSDWPALVPYGGFLGFLVLLIVNFMRQGSSDRSGYRAEITQLRTDHAAEIKKLTTHHDAQIKDLRDQIEVLRAEVHDLRQQVEDERRARWQAEDAAARFRRMVDSETAEGGHDEPHA